MGIEKKLPSVYIFGKSSFVKKYKHHPEKTKDKNNKKPTTTPGIKNKITSK